MSDQQKKRRVPLQQQTIKHIIVPDLTKAYKQTDDQLIKYLQVISAAIFGLIVFKDEIWDAIMNSMPDLPFILESWENDGLSGAVKALNQYNPIYQYIDKQKRKVEGSGSGLEQKLSE